MTLINPKYNTRFPQPPLGLLHLASYIEGQTDWIVEIIDCNVLDVNPEYAVSLVNKKTDIIGLTGMTPNVNFSFSLARQIKKGLNVPVFFGGPHITVLPLRTMQQVPEINVGIIGEGELTIVELLENCGNKRLHGIKGIIYRNKGKIVLNEPRPLIKDLDSLPFPSYDLLERPLTRYKPFPPHGRDLPFMSVVSSRGCPYDCSFCSHSVFGRAYNCFSASYVFEHMKFLKEEYGVRYIQFYDDSFTLNKKRIHELCGLLKNNGLDLSWSCETRVNLVDKKLLKEMRDAGCGLVGFGVESGVQRVLDVLNKQITLKQIRNAVNWCSGLGITSVGYFMLGCPSETREEMLESVRFSKSVPIDFVQWSIVTPYLGTRLYDQAVEAGVIFPEDWDNYVYVDLANIKRDTVAIANENLTAGELQDIQARAYREFYFRKEYIFRRLRKNVGSWKELKTSIRGLKMLVEALQ